MSLFGKGSSGGVFNDLKDRIGAGSRSNSGDYGPDYDRYSDNFDDYSTYDRDSSYNERARVIERDPRDRRYYSGVYRGNRSTPFPSRDEIRRHTPEPNYNIVPRASENRTSFRSTDYLSSGAVERESAAEARKRPRRPGYGDFGGVNRKLVVIVPTTYEDAERVSAALKASDAVVLNLKEVRPDLTKRILDFSFGAASMCDARVDCIGSKVFAMTLGCPITEGERVRLRSQGVIL